MTEQVTSWKFIDSEGGFVLRHPERTSYLYFPLANERGMKCAITPELQGDAKVDQDTFLLAPTTVEDLHHSSFGRNFWIRLNDGSVWSVAGKSARQRADSISKHADEVTLEAGLLWHRVTRVSATLGLRVVVTNFVPAGGGHVELMKVAVTNTSDRGLTIMSTAAIPIYGRSADNVRDHRHVTSLLHRIHVTRYGVVVQPALSFDERGHRGNDVSYGVCGVQGDGDPPAGFFPLLADFVGEGGSLDWPKAITTDLPVAAEAGDRFEGGEAMGALRFACISLEPGATVEYRLVLGVGASNDHADDWRYLASDAFDDALQDTRQYWTDKANRLRVATAAPDFDRWLRWVAIQPALRRIYGCSFLPYHDYGRGGRGWRDLWQDCLALLLMEPDGVRELLIGNFAGVRMDGSNATIIGSAAGEFIADRNSIPRVWMDHAAWSWLTTKLYLDQTGDLGFLFEEQTYFRDQHTERCRKQNGDWRPDDGTSHRTQAGEVHRGSVLEHLLIQNLAAFFNVGEHNHMLLEGGDWNDGLDMAGSRGESVALSTLYARNLLQIADVLDVAADRHGLSEVALAEECAILLDSLNGGVDYAAPQEKRDLLKRYLAAVVSPVVGRKVNVSIDRLATDLRLKGEWIRDHVRSTEWVRSSDGNAWFNGYYDDDSRCLEGDQAAGVRMTLTGQVFAILSGTANDDQVGEIIKSVNALLWDERVGGCRLNTNFRDVLMNIGRCFGFAYGEKENGAVFCHMAVMYACALYTRNRPQDGHRILDALYRQSRDFPTSRMYPGIPEYFNPKGRGMYPYLTGSASWYLLTMLTEVFGVRGCLGDLILDPRLEADRFDADSVACVDTVFAGKRIRVSYRNPARIGSHGCNVSRVTLSGRNVTWKKSGRGAMIARQVVDELAEDTMHEFRVDLE